MVNSVSKSKKDITMYRYNEYIARYVVSLKRRLSKPSSNFPEFNRARKLIVDLEQWRHACSFLRLLKVNRNEISRSFQETLRSPISLFLSRAGFLACNRVAIANRNFLPKEFHRTKPFAKNPRPTIQNNPKKTRELLKPVPKNRLDVPILQQLTIVTSPVRPQIRSFTLFNNRNTFGDRNGNLDGNRTLREKWSLTSAFSVNLRWISLNPIKR